MFEVRGSERGMGEARGFMNVGMGEKKGGGGREVGDEGSPETLSRKSKDCTPTLAGTVVWPTHLCLRVPFAGGFGTGLLHRTS